MCTVWSEGRGYHLKRGLVPLHDVFGVNCNNGSTTENQGSGVEYIGLGMLDECMCVI